MQLHDKRCYIGLAAIVVIVCLLAGAALGAYLLDIVDRDDIDAWMQATGSGLVARIEPLPEERPAPEARFTSAGQSPFAHELLRPRRKPGR